MYIFKNDIGTKPEPDSIEQKILDVLVSFIFQPVSHIITTRKFLFFSSLKSSAIRGPVLL